MRDRERGRDCLIKNMHKEGSDWINHYIKCSHFTQCVSGAFLLLFRESNIGIFFFKLLQFNIKSIKAM